MCLQPLVDNEPRNSRGYTDVLTLFSVVFSPQLAACVFKSRPCPTLRRGLAEVSVAALRQLRSGLCSSCGSGTENLTFSTPPVCPHTLKLTVTAWNGLRQSLRFWVHDKMGQRLPFVEDQPLAGQFCPRDGSFLSPGRFTRSCDIMWNHKGQKHLFTLK